MKKWDIIGNPGKSSQDVQVLGTFKGYQAGLGKVRNTWRFVIKILWLLTRSLLLWQGLDGVRR
jgi:hypothetical protein